MSPFLRVKNLKTGSGTVHNGCCFSLLVFGGAVICHFPVKFVYQSPTIRRQVNFSQSAFVVNLYGCAVFHGLGNIIDVNIIAEDSRRVNIGAFYRRAGKTDESSIG